MPSDAGRHCSQLSPRIVTRSVSVVPGIVAILLAALAVSIAAQDVRVPVVRTTTRLVQLDVVVLDDQHHPVTNLSQQDFRVFDNGREQKLSHFSVISTSATGPRPAPSPLVITNRPQGQGEPPGTMTVILVDELVEQDVFATEIRALMQSARLQILKFLGTLQPGDQVALYALRSEGVAVIHDFTDDPSELVVAAEALGSGLLKGATPTSADIGRTAPPAAQEIHTWLAGSDRKGNVTRDYNSHRVLAGSAFQAISRHLHDIPGRKNVVWISATFPSMVNLNPALMADERNTILPDPYTQFQSPHFANTESRHERMQAFARWLSSTNVSVYPVDPRGFMGPVGLLGVGADQKFDGPPPDVKPTVVPLANGPWSTMDLVASETGGRAFYDTNGLDQTLREVLDESRVAYELGYYPGDGAWDGKYHQIEVKAKGDGFRIRCRKGYFAIDEPPRNNPETALLDAAKSAVESLGIGLTVQVPSNPLSWSKQDIVLNIDTHDVHFDEKDGRWKAQLDVVLAQLAKDGRVLDGAKDRLELVLHPNTYDEAMERGWFYPKSVNINPKAEKLRVVVRDLTTGATGSVSVPVRHDKNR